MNGNPGFFASHRQQRHPLSTTACLNFQRKEFDFSNTAA
jgi:hypothetical protein